MTRTLFCVACMHGGKKQVKSKMEKLLNIVLVLLIGCNVVFASTLVSAPRSVVRWVESFLENPGTDVENQAHISTTHVLEKISLAGPAVGNIELPHAEK